MEEIEVKWKHAAQVWWSWFWRSMLLMMTMSILVGLVSGVAMSIMNIEVDQNVIYLQTVGVLIGVYFSVRVMKEILNKSFKGYRIVLVKDSGINSQDKVEQTTDIHL